MNPLSFCCLGLLCILQAGCESFRQNPTNSLAGKTVVITGASSGFGQGAARRFAAEGANVVIAARRTELLKQVARDCGPRALPVTTDVAHPEEVARLALAAVKRFGRIDIWVNNAGVGVVSRFENAPPRDYSRLIDINLKGVVYGSQAAMRQFHSQGAGTLVNVGSIDSEVPLAYQAVYSATKAGVLALDRALIEEIRLSGAARRIRVATIMPWAADTPWWRHAANYSGHTARMAAMDDPDKVVRAIVRAAVHPREEYPVGWKAQASALSHRLLPDFTESFSANVAHRQMLKGNALPATSGTLHQPMSSGTGVSDGVRQRMKEEDATAHSHR